MKRDEVIQYFDSFTWSSFKAFYESYENYLKSVDPARIEPSVKFPEHAGELLGIDIRFNDDNHFNDADHFNNDLFIVMEIVDEEHSIRTHFVKVTCDPCRMKEGIAHLARQIFRGNIGFHQGDGNRICIRSDFGQGTWLRRTHNNGDVIQLNNGHYDAAASHSGVNHHESPYKNSSLGCVIWDEKQHEDDMKPLLTHALKYSPNKNSIPMLVSNIEDVESDVRKFFDEAKSVSGHDNDATGEAGHGTLSQDEAEKRGLDRV